MPQKQIVLKNCSPGPVKDIEDYLVRGGFKALDKAFQLSPEEIVNVVKESGLRGRGGAGYPTGLKWEYAARAKTGVKYLVCNADEGEVGTFKDRFLIENDPFSLIEGMALASYAIGASKAFVYLRGEYQYLLPRLESAIGQVKNKGYLNRDNFKLEIEICENAGAYVCGEETALMESIEGKRGEARFKPPFPPAKGLWQKPTVINNVETLMNIPHIVLNGASWFRGVGTERSKGTKIFSVSGDVEKPGIYELVMGSTLKELVIDLCGAKDVKMIQVGGAAGRVLPASELEQELSFETMLGAGAIIVYNKDRDVLGMVVKTIEFFVEESCGKCVPCREGTAVMYQMLIKGMRNKGFSPEELNTLYEISDTMKSCSLCGLGQSVPTCFEDTLRYFPQSYRSKI